MVKNDLEPEDWAEFRSVAHDLLDACIDRLSNAREHPWQPVPEVVRRSYQLGDGGEGVGHMAERLKRDVMPYATGNTHPRFFGWVHGSGLPVGLLSEMVAATMNSNCGGRDHGAVYLEREVINWAKGVFGFPEGASGILTTGTSQATVIALAGARVRALGARVRTEGGRGQAQLVAYAGGAVHNATVKAMELLGIGRAHLRRIAEDGDGRLDILALRAVVAADRAEGLLPFAVVGTAGTVDLGQVDDLGALADFAEAENMWLHVDGAFGAWLQLAGGPWAALVRGIERADSLACDFHKWMYVPYDCGMVLIKDEAEHRAAFAARPSYLEGLAQGVAGGEPWFCDYGVDLSRGNRALKVWAALVAHEPDALGAAIAGNCEQAHEMGRRVESMPDMALLRPVVTNLCVFTADTRRVRAEQSALNKAIAQRLQLDGHSVFSTVEIDGVTGLRAAITNHRTKMADISAAIEEVARVRDAL